MASHLNHIVVATDETVYIYSPSKSRLDNVPFEFPLEDILSRPPDTALMPGYGKNRAATLLVVPDLWLKHEFFAFQSQKMSLVDAFLERKLKASRPHLSKINRFFTFSFKASPADERGVNVFFLQEEKAFLVNDALTQAKLAPRWITTPALLWADRLRKTDPDFKRQGVLLLDLRQEHVFLYFFSGGEFLFSRRLTLPNGSGWGETLLYEINQSIYLYAQKAKSALNKICAAGDVDEIRESLAGKLDIPIHRLAAESTQAVLPRNLSFMEGVWHSGGIEIPSESYSVTDRAIRRELKWKPVQWCGIITAAVSIIALSGINLWLGNLLQDRMLTRSALMEKHSKPLADIEQMLDALSQRAGRMPTAHAFMQIGAAMTDSMRISEIKINHETSSLELSATINTDHVDRFRQSMKLFAANLNRRLELDHAISIEDMAFQVDDLKQSAGKTIYRFSLKAMIP
jgi:hypothetical protein